MKTEIIRDETFRHSTHVILGGDIDDVRKYVGDYLGVNPHFIAELTDDASASASTFTIPHKDHPSAMLAVWFPTVENTREFLWTIVHEATHVAVINLFDRVGHPSDRTHGFQEVLAYMVEKYTREFINIIEKHHGTSGTMRVRKALVSHRKAQSHKRVVKAHTTRQARRKGKVRG